MLFYKINAVSFTDINLDGFTDIIVVTEFFRGWGSMKQKYAPQYIYDIYFGSKNKFYTDKNITSKLDLDSDKNITISDIKHAYSKLIGH